MERRGTSPSDGFGDARTLEDETGRAAEDPGSPPLEGGESLCELLLDNHPGVKEKVHHLQSLQSGLPSYLEDSVTTATTDRLRNVFPSAQEMPPTTRDSSSFLTILEKELVPYATFTQTFLQSILASVDSKDPVVANAWVETLLDVIDLLPKEVIKNDILSLAVAKGQMSQPVTSRLSCCRMLGKVCAKFEPYTIKKEILPVVQSLCQDVDYEVRGCMCRQLDAVARGLGLEATKSAILPELVELANDEESYVRLAGIETVVSMLSLLDDETCTQIIVPLVKKFCENSMKSEDVTLPVVAKQLGKLCHGLSVNLTVDQKFWFLDFFRQVSRMGLQRRNDAGDLLLHSNGASPMPDIVPRMDELDGDRSTECRHCSAYNFPAIVLFAGALEFQTQLYETFRELASDPQVKVRRTIACGFHEVAKLLGPQVNLIHGELAALLRDESMVVLTGLIHHLPVTLEAMAREGTMGSESKLTGRQELMAAILYCENAISETSNWRLHVELLEKLACLPKCLPNNVIFHRFVPLFFEKLFTARPIPCRTAASSTLLMLLRSNQRQDQRNEICQRLVEELCHAHSCHHRMLFITVCELVLDMFSKTFFKEHFFMPILGMAGDPVANVRLRLCAVIPRLKQLLKCPTDGELLQELEICVGKLMIDEEDRDVSAAVRHAILELDKIEVPMEVQTKQGIGESGASTHEDTEDRRRENEERVTTAPDMGSPTSLPSSPASTSPRKVGQPLGRIPVRCGRDKTPGKAFPATTPPSPTHVSRIPMPARVSAPGETGRKCTSPPRSNVGAVKPTPAPRTRVGSPVPSPEAIRRANQNRPSPGMGPTQQSFGAFGLRRKSLGPGTNVQTSIDPASRNRARLSVTGGSPRTSSAGSHIPIQRYPSSTSSSPSRSPPSSPFYSRPASVTASDLLEDALVESFLLHRCHSRASSASNSPYVSLTTNSSGLFPPADDDYEPELLEVGEEDELEEPLHRSTDSWRLPPGPSGWERGGRGVGGGGKIYAQWSLSHLPRCSTPPPSTDKSAAFATRACRSASSSPTRAPPPPHPRSSIPRYVGSPQTAARGPSPPRSFIQPTTSRLESPLLRASSRPDLRNPYSPTRQGKSASLPGTPRSASPTRPPFNRISYSPSSTYRNSFTSSGLIGSERQSPPVYRRRVATVSPARATLPLGVSLGTRQPTSRSVRSLVRELETLAATPRPSWNRAKTGHK